MSTVHSGRLRHRCCFHSGVDVNTVEMYMVYITVERVGRWCKLAAIREDHI